ncbi:MAG: hypothetical protein JWP91_2783 [Fibrobacteres bacterium]|nr:hypothetical protein [Fibrobacterota bacterium]
MRFGSLLVTCLMAAAPARAFELGAQDLKVGGYVDGGRFQLADSSSNGEILNRMGAKWALDKEIDDNWAFMASLHWMFWRNQATDLALFHIAGLKFDSDLQGSLSYRSGANRFRMGLYEFKYNPDSKNLGEYLLRSEAYPTIIENSQGKDLLSYSFSRVSGMEYGLDFPLIRQTALVYAEQYNIPVNDVSFAYFASGGPTYAELQVGGALHRRFRFGKATRTTNLEQSLKDYVAGQGLTTQAVKLMLRGRLDLGMIRNGSPGFTLYGEAAMLGLRNDSLFYKHPMERVPLMAGMDLPTFGFLTALSMEVEYLKNPYYGRKYSVGDATGSNFSPLPNLNQDEYGGGRIPDYTKDDLKWSLFLHKSLNRWIDLKARFASDHLRLLAWDGDYATGEALTRKTGDWYFLARIEYHN